MTQLFTEVALALGAAIIGNQIGVLCGRYLVARINNN